MKDKKRQAAWIAIIIASFFAQSQSQLLKVDNDLVSATSTMTVTYTIPSTQSFAAGDCINIDLAANPYSGGAYSPFADPLSCTIITGPSLQKCQIPTSATSVGQSAQFLFGSTAGSRSFQGTLKFKNPFSQRSLTFKVSFLKSCTGTQLGPQSLALNFKTGTIPTATLESNSLYIGDTNAVLTVKFQVGTTLRMAGRIELEVPLLYDPQDGSTIPVLDSSITAPAVTSAGDGVLTKGISVISRSFDTNRQLLSIDYTISTTVSSGQWIQFSVSNFLNPINYSPMTGFKIQTYETQSSGSSALIDTTSSSFSLTTPSTAQLKAQTMKNGAVDIVLTGTDTSDYHIGKKGRDLVLSFQVGMPLEPTCFLKVTFPEEIKLNIDETVTIVKGTGGFMDGANVLVSISPYGSGGNYAILTGCATVSTGYSQSTILTFQKIVSPGQIKEVSGIKVELATDAGITKVLATGTNQQGFMIQKSKFIGGAIAGFSFAPFSGTGGSNIVQEQSSYVATFTLETNLYSSSVIEITLPTYLTSLTTTPTCILTGSNVNVNAPCSKSTAGNSVLITSPFQETSTPSQGWDFNPTGSRSISVKISSATNPISSKDAGTWKVTTYNSIGGVLYIVDTGSPPSTQSPLSFIAQIGSLQKAANIIVNPDETSYESATYTFQITLSHSLPAQAQVVLTTPTEITIPTPAIIRSSCFYYPPSSTSAVTQACSVTGSTITMQLSVAHDSSNPLKLELKGFKNPRTQKVTGSFIVFTKDKDGKIDDIGTNTNMIVQMTKLASVTYMSVTPSNLTNGASNPYQLSFVSPITLMNGDKIVFTLDSSIKPITTTGASSGTVVCKPLQQITTISCQYSSNILTVTLSSVSSLSGTFSFSVVNITNPPSTKLQKVIQSAIFTDSFGNQLMQLPSTIFVMVQTQFAANILTYSLTQSTLEHSTPARYKFTFKPTNPISGTGSITLTWPVQVVLPNQIRCTVTTYTSFTDKCNFNNITRTLIIKNVFDATSTIPFSGTITIELDSMINPADNRIVNGFTITTFDDLSQALKIDKLDDNILVPQTLCNYPCKECSSSTSDGRNDCTACWPDSSQPYLQLSTSNGIGTCKQSCDSGFSTNGDPFKKCQICDASCSQCVDNAQAGDKARCVVCAPGYNYTYTPQQKCMKTCNTKGFYEASPYMCSLCASSCSTCDRSATNCTSCNINNPQFRYLYEFQCIENCPVGYIAQGAQCIKCDSKCATCKDLTTTCTTCDSSSKYKYHFGFNCIDQCPLGTQADKQKLICVGCLKNCKLCDNLNQTKCLACESGFYEYQGDCVKTCPEGTSPNFLGTSCTRTFTFSFPSIPYPHLAAAGVMLLVSLISEIKDRKSLFITGCIVLWSPVQFISYLSLTVFSVLYSTNKFAGASGLGFVSYLILNIAGAIAFEHRIARKDIEYMHWRSIYSKTSRILIILSGLLSFKILRMHYTLFFGQGCFKAGFQFPGVFQRQIIIFTMVHMIFSTGIIIGVDIVGLLYLQWGTQLTTTMVETAILSLVVIALEFVELCNLRKYLGDDERVDYEKLLGQLGESMDKKLRQDMLKQIMNHVRGNKDLCLNNRFDELLTDMGPRRCRSMCDLGEDLEDDPRATKSAPGSRRGDRDVGFDTLDPLPTIDNVYAESKPADPLGRLGKTFSDFDMQVVARDFDKILSRKGGDFVQFDQSLNNEYLTKRNRKNKGRGRKNQYYAQIDAEDDEEASHLGTDEGRRRGDDLDVIKEEDDDEEVRRLKKERKLKQAKEQQEEEEKKRQQELARKQQEEEKQELEKIQKENEERMKRERLEKERLEREALEKQYQQQQQQLAEEKAKREAAAKKKKEEEEEIKRQQEIKRLEELKKKEELEKEMQRLEEERLKKEAEERERKLKEEEESKRLEEEIAKAHQKAAQAEKPQTAESRSDKVLMNSQANLRQFHPVEPVVQVPPDAQKRNFNESDILGEFDRDEKGSVILLQDENGQNVDKLGRRVNERGYLLNPANGDILENYQNQKMFAKEDMDERGEVPAPFCVEKFNFNPLTVKGDLDYDRAGRPVFQNKGKQVDKRGRPVNKKGWLVDALGNICDHHGRKKFDQKQLTAEGDFPRLFNLSGRRFDISDVCGQLSRDQNNQLIFKKNKKGQQVDNAGKLVNERGYLIDASGNIVDRDGKKLFERKYLKNGEFPKIFPFTKFNIKRVLGNFEMDPIGNPILDRGPNGVLLDREGRPVNERGYLIDREGNVIDNRGKTMFEKEVLDQDGEIPKVFRTGLLKSDTASSLSRLMSEIERNQPSEYGIPQWKREQQKQELLRVQQQKREADRQAIEAAERLSGNTSVDSMMEDTPSNYNIANQRFDQTSELLQTKSQQLAQGKNAGTAASPLHQQQMPVDEIQEEESQFDGDFAAADDQIMRKRRLKKKKKVVVQVYNDPSEKDIKMAKAYGGVPRGAPKKVITKTVYRDIQTPLSAQNRQYNPNASKISGMVSGLQRDTGPHNMKSLSRLEEVKDAGHLSSLPGLHNESNEASMLAVPEHHIREQRLKQKKMNELKQKNKTRKQANRGAGDPDFEKMFGKDIDEFLEDSDWDIESFDNMSQYSKGTSRSMLQDGRIRGLESIYLQRIETSMKRGGAFQTRKHSKKPQKNIFRPPMHDQFLHEQSSHVLMPPGTADNGMFNDQSSMQHSRIQRPQFMESANTTSLQLNRANGVEQPFSRTNVRPVNQTQYQK